MELWEMKKLILTFSVFLAVCGPALADRDDSHGHGGDRGEGGYFGVPGPIVGAGLPLVAAAGYGVYWLIRRRQKPEK
jgi:drug/metabolite transporter (DMT)-like permease